MLSQAYIDMVATSPRYQAFDALLRRPDPPDLLAPPDATGQRRPRGHRLAQFGKANRDADILMPLLMKWLQHLRIQDDPDSARLLKYRNYYATARGAWR